MNKNFIEKSKIEVNSKEMTIIVTTICTGEKKAEFYHTKDGEELFMKLVKGKSENRGAN
ncbi:hypothetical protein [Enterococcus faecalis]|uniref:hypothetical protein n=1 Tax=Enterococcus faecalis TaxID=1351 RepID=UPI003D145AB5